MIFLREVLWYLNHKVVVNIANQVMVFENVGNDIDVLYEINVLVVEVI